MSAYEGGWCNFFTVGCTFWLMTGKDSLLGSISACQTDVIYFLLVEGGQ